MGQGEWPWIGASLGSTPGRTTYKNSIGAINNLGFENFLRLSSTQEKVWIRVVKEWVKNQIHYLESKDLCESGCQTNGHGSWGILQREKVSHIEYNHPHFLNMLWFGDIGVSAISVCSMKGNKCTLVFFSHCFLVFFCLLHLYYWYKDSLGAMLNSWLAN